MPFVASQDLIVHGEDQLMIEGIHLEAIIGFSKHETNILQPLKVDLVIDHERAAALTDNPSEAIDYKELKNQLRSDLLGQRFNLIETLAEEVARRVLAHNLARKVTVTVHKPGALTGARDVAIRITRSHA